jgi:diaminohydroxyphosphoribosylaminopyrimidine deaminase/5-amino-6-(5-phosphoribosylamino)uracil reductase
LRGSADAILIGAETARQDNPRLTVRLPGRRGRVQPWRVVLTNSGTLPRQLHLFTDRQRARTLVFHRRSLDEVLAELGARDVAHVLIEGGGRILTEAFRLGLVNEVAFFLAPALMGTSPRALHPLPAAVRLEKISYRAVGPDLLCRGLVVTNPPAALD